MKTRTGFANPEYLITLTAVVVILALIVPPIARERQRRRSLNALSSLRAAMARYAAQTKTKGPLELSDLTREGYLPEIPPAEVFGLHPRSTLVSPLGRTDDSGGWTHSNWPGGRREGEIWINCTHTDGRGALWSAY